MSKTIWQSVQNVKWGPEPKAMLERFSQNGTKLMVFGREIDGKFVTADEAISHSHNLTNLLPCVLPLLERQ